MAQGPPSTPLLEGGFDHLGPAVRHTRVASGRDVRFVDEGDLAWTPLLVFGGAGTSVRAVGLLEFARSLREELQVRLLSVERNGLGQTSFDPALGYAEYAADVWCLLDQLSVETVSLAAISGGGPYLAHVAALHPERVRSVHLACAFAERLGAEPAPWSVESIVADPVAWWTFPPDSQVHRIPGFVDAAVDEAVRAVFARGPGAAEEGLRHAFDLYDRVSLPDVSSVVAPVFLYWGTEDTLVPMAQLRRWEGALANVSMRRIYDGEAHDVQYRHWDQLVCDAATLGQCVVVSEGGKTLLVPGAQAEERIEAGATLGMAAWAERWQATAAGRAGEPLRRRWPP